MEKDILVLGIESSCDETSCAVVKNGREVLSNVINSQIKIHEQYGGVVPEIASRCHTEVINQVMKQALRDANVSLDDISKEIDRLYHDGNISSSKVLINSLRDSGFSDSNIVSCIFNRVESGFLNRDIYMPIVNSYIEKYIQPEIVRNLSSKSVGEVLDILYSRYSESIVNKAMCMYLSSHYLVD